MLWKDTFSFQFKNTLKCLWMLDVELKGIKKTLLPWLPRRPYLNEKPNMSLAHSRGVWGHFFQNIVHLWFLPSGGQSVLWSCRFHCEVPSTGCYPPMIVLHGFFSLSLLGKEDDSFKKISSSTWRDYVPLNKEEKKKPALILSGVENESVAPGSH